MLNYPSLVLDSTSNVEGFQQSFPILLKISCRHRCLFILSGRVKGGNQPGMLGKLAAGLTASEDINKAQQYQAEDNSLKAIEHYKNVNIL